jgi:hypothetical protein
MLRYEAPCEERRRTSNTHPCRLEGRPGLMQRPGNGAAGAHSQSPAGHHARIGRWGHRDVLRIVWRPVPFAARKITRKMVAATSATIASAIGVR